LIPLISYIIHIIKFHRGHSISAGEPTVKVNLAAAFGTKWRVFGCAGFAAGGARAHKESGVWVG
jgi:hypothetical protein